MTALLDLMGAALQAICYCALLVGIGGIGWQIGACIRFIADSQREQRESLNELRRAGR